MKWHWPFYFGAGLFAWFAGGALDGADSLLVPLVYGLLSVLWWYVGYLVQRNDV